MQARSYCRLQGVYLFFFYFSPFWVVVAFPVRLAGVCLLSNCLFASRTLPALTCSHTTIDRLLGLRSSIFHLKPLFSLLFFFFFSVLSLGNALALTDFLPHSGNAPSVRCSRRAWASTSQARAMPSGMTAPGGGLCSQKQTLEPPDIPPSSQELAWQLLKQNLQARCA